MRKKIIYLAALILAVGYDATAQTQYNDQFLSIYVNPQQSAVLLTTKNLDRTQTDSLSKDLQGAFGLSAGITYRKELKKNWFLTTGVEFQLSRFKRTMQDAFPVGHKFHPDVPANEQLIVTFPGPKADYQYRCYYANIPFQFERRVLQNIEMEEPWFLYLQLGITPQYLVTQNLYLQLKGFTIDSKNRFPGLDADLTPNRVNANFNLGFAAYYKHSEKLGYFLQPNFNAQLLPINRGDASYRMWFVGVRFGAYFMKAAEKK